MGRWMSFGSLRSDAATCWQVCLRRVQPWSWTTTPSELTDVRDVVALR
jgi:hypothetical protein